MTVRSRSTAALSPAALSRAALSLTLAAAMVTTPAAGPARGSVRTPTVATTIAVAGAPAVATRPVLARAFAVAGAPVVAVRPVLARAPAVAGAPAVAVRPVLARALAVAGAPAVAVALPARTARGPGVVLRSADGRSTLSLRRGGRLVLARGSSVLWATRAVGAHPRVVLRRGGDLAVVVAGVTRWRSHTRGSRAGALVLGDDARLRLRSAAGTVWTSADGNRCRSGAGNGRRVVVDLGEQSARLCAGAEQILSTPITSGASALGAATPTGRWRVQARERERYLYPASGGAYYVHYWVPYDGAYGIHDSSWQDFPYGSPAYRTRGSHGCIHVPRPVMDRLFRWVSIGTLVVVHA